ncbi:MAG: Sjogren's syndrome/scleroderma autoantigen 1 family protein [Haloarculaceae archaeon]
MSDFDREAERERLREKYEREQEKRESTERMSELLLKGATMTDAHCGNCGDPIFRYDGEEFCPTCQERVADSAAETDDESAGDRDGMDATGGSSRAEPGPASADAPRDADAGTTPDAGTAEADTETAGSRDGTGANQPVGATGRDAPAPSADANDTARPPEGRTGSSRDPARQSQAERSRSPADRGSDAADVDAARASLTRTLLAQARKAENCDDPRRARDHLAAAREAAETLGALSY